MWLEVARRSGVSVSTFILDSLKAIMLPGEVERAVQMAVNRKAQINQKAK
jgi:N-glycosylase/DNA lyase